MTLNYLQHKNYFYQSFARDEFFKHSRRGKIKRLLGIQYKFYNCKLLKDKSLFFLYWPLSPPNHCNSKLLIWSAYPSKMTKQVHCNTGKYSLRETFDIQSKEKYVTSSLKYSCQSKDEQWWKLPTQQVSLENFSQRREAFWKVSSI